MRRLALPIGLAAAFGTGCVNDDISLFIQGAKLIDPGKDCTVAADGDEFIAAGLLDVLGGSSYTGAFVVVTNLPATFNNQEVTQDPTRSPNYPDYGGVDNNVVTVDSAKTTFTFVLGEEDAGNVDNNVSCKASGECSLQDAEATAAATIFNTNTQLSQDAVVFAEVVPAATVKVLNDNLADVLKVPTDRLRMTASVKLEGSTTGNTGLRRLSTIAFPFQIDVCRGCLVPDKDFCATLDAAPESTGTGSCGFGQDFPLTQCVCGDGTTAVSDVCATPAP